MNNRSSSSHGDFACIRDLSPDGGHVPSAVIIRSGTKHYPYIDSGLQGGNDTDATELDITDDNRTHQSKHRGGQSGDEVTDLPHMDDLTDSGRPNCASILSD